MKKVSLFKSYGALNSAPVFDAFENGLRTHGFTVVHDIMDADVAVIWSVLWHGRMNKNRQVWEHFKNLNKPVIILEVGAVKRGVTWRVGLNGISRSALITKDKDDFITDITQSLKPWRDSGDYILICGQNDKSLLWNSMPKMGTWVSNVIEKIQNYTSRPIIFRPHPRCPVSDIESYFKNVYRQTPAHMSSTYDTYNLNFDNIHAVVSWSSSPGSLAVINGVPVFAGVDNFAYPVANAELSDIETPAMPDRNIWFSEFLNSEFTLNELTAGMPLKTLTKYI
jgi:hypothetical protein